MLTTDDLLTAGYRQFHNSMAASRIGVWYRASFQKRFDDETGKRFFITIDYGVVPPINGQPARSFFTPQAQFNKDKVCFNVEMISGGETVEEIEAFFDVMWTTMRIDYYEGGPDETRSFPQI